MMDELPGEGDSRPGDYTLEMIRRELFGEPASETKFSAGNVVHVAGEWVIDSIDEDRAEAHVTNRRTGAAATVPVAALVPTVWEYAARQFEQGPDV
jgi:hypothetical protein